MTLAELAHLYLSNHLISRSSYRTTHRLIRNTFEPIRSICVNDLTPKTILSWHSSLRQTPHQANRGLGTLRAMIRWGIRLNLCSTDPTTGVQRFPVHSRSRYLSQNELHRLLTVLAKSSPKVRTYFTLVLCTGARRSEAQQMRWTDLDPIQQRWIKPKTKSGRWQIVPLPYQAVTLLTTLPHTSIWVFPGLNTQAWSVAGIEKAWSKVRIKARIPDVRIHDLRRTAASYMAIHGENLSVIQQMLDHSSLQPTAIYARLNISTLRRAIQANANRFFQHSHPETSDHAF